MARNRFFEDEAYDERAKYGKIKRILRYLNPYKKLLIKVGFLIILMSFVALIPPYLNSLIVDKVMGRADGYLALAILLLSAWFLIAAADIVYNFFRYKFMSRTAYSIVRDLRREIFYHLQELSFDYYDNRPAGKILVRVTSYIDEISNVFSRSIFGMIMDLIKSVLILAWMYILDYRFAALVTAAFAPMVALLFLLQREHHRRHRRVRNKSANRTAYIAENIQGIQVTKAFNRAELNTEIYAGVVRDTANAWLRFIRTNEFFWPLFDFFNNLATLGVYALAFILATSAGMDAISLGKLLSFTMYLGMLAGPLFNIAAYMQEIGSANSNLERIFETLDTPASIHDAPDAVDLPEVTGHVEFDDVTFAYEQDKVILEHFSLDVPAGKCIALVGPTGAGKTTVVNLLSRFYEAGENKIRIDGADIAKVKLHSLRSQVGVMMQDSFLFSGTILDNIRYARPYATDAECIAAAEKACCDEFIRKLPDGYNTVLAEKGAGLSGGEIQLLSMARIIVTDPRILILDEATSSVDAETEAKIQEALDVVLLGRTSFVIAHRLSTIKRADCILYIADKGIMEAGTHEELMEKKGRYYSLAKREI